MFGRKERKERKEREKKHRKGKSTSGKSSAVSQPSTAAAPQNSNEPSEAKTLPPAAQSYFETPEAAKSSATTDVGKVPDKEEHFAVEPVKMKKKKKKKKKHVVERMELPHDEVDDKIATTDLRDLQLLEPTNPEDTPEVAFRRALPDEVFSAYSTLLGLARDLNTPIQFPELVFIGLAGHGKSSLLEAVLGEVFNVVGSGATMRPLFFQFINNRKVSKPRVIIKRDPTSAAYDNDTEVSLSSLEKELRARMEETEGEETPLYVTYEAPDVLNLSLIDTPGLGQDEVIDELVLQLCKEPNRRIIAVQHADELGSNALLSYLRDVDPDLTRTTLVYSKLHDALQTIQSADELGKFLSRRLDDTQTFFTSLPFFGVRLKVMNKEDYREVLFKMFHRDLQNLEAQQYDVNFRPSIGVFNFRDWVQNMTWKHFQHFIPRITQSARQKRRQTDAKLKEVRTQISSIDTSKLRALSSRYVTEFLQCIGALIQGTAEGNTIVSGETLLQEQKSFGDTQWRDANNYPLDIDKDALEVPFASTKLYGGQQLERLLAEFAAVANLTEIREPSKADVANAAGVNKLENTADITWAASDLAQQRSKEILAPLIRQLAARATYVMKRLADISRKMMEARRGGSQWQGASMNEAADVDDVTQYPLFRHLVREEYHEFIAEQAKTCEKKCLDEFYSTKTVHWYLSEKAAKDIDNVDASDTRAVKDAVVRISMTIFEELRERIVRNVVLKFYNFFLVPIQTELWNSLQGRVSALNDDDIRRKFEVDMKVTRLQQTERKLMEEGEALNNTEVDIVRAASQYNNPLIL